MERRIAALAMWFVGLSLSGAALAAGGPAGPAAPVGWPVSTLLLSEVQTGGASASDEFAELTNAGPAAVDLAGLEVAYVTSTGGTITRKASWSATLLLEPGRHLLLANSAGAFAGIADGTYSGGLAATGGALVLRPIGGAPIDAIGWGDATNGFVEGTAAPAPVAGTSLERLPGGLDGNTVDSNDNQADWFVQADPSPQSLAAPPAPAPIPTPTPSASVGPSPSPSASPEPSTTPSPTVDASVDPGPEATPSDAAPTDPPSPEPTSTEEPSSTPVATDEPSTEPTPSLEPTPSAAPTDTPAPSPPTEPTPFPSASIGPSPLPTQTSAPATPIVEARSQANGSTARIEGILTTRLGALESGRKAFLQDETGGIALYLDVEAPDLLPAGTHLVVVGTLDDRFSERTLRIRVADIVALGEAPQPPPWLLRTGEVGEAVEGYRAIVQGTTIGSPTDLADGLGLLVDDGTGQVRVIVSAPALAGAVVPAGTPVVAVGPVGQRDSTGTGLSGYRVHATEAGDFGIVVPPTPSPEPTTAPTNPAGPSPTPSAAPSSSPGPSPTPSIQPTVAPTATPAASASPAPTSTPVPSPLPGVSIAEARAMAVGATVTVAGVVTAEAGRLGTPSLIAIADGTAGIVVRVPEGVAAPPRGALVSVRGPLAEPYGQLEIRPSAAGFRMTGQGSLPAPITVTGTELGEATEGRLVQLEATVSTSPKKATSGDLTIDLVDQAGTPVRVLADGSSGITAADLVKGRAYRLTGIVGQRASRKGELDGYRVDLRDRDDIVPLAGAPGASGQPASTLAIATVAGLPDGTLVTVEGTVTAGVTLLDSSGRRIVLQDGGGAIEVLLPAGQAGPRVGDRLRVSGASGRAWGAPQIAARSVEVLGAGELPRALGLARQTSERDEWLLVRVSGVITSVQRLGDHWRAEVAVDGGTRILVVGQAGAAIPSTAIVIGRRITVTGIVRRPYPTASDRRFAVLPRDRGDVAIGPAGAGLVATAGSSAAPIVDDAGSADVTPDTDLATLADHVGEAVRVGGLVARIGPDGFDLDDGTALARLVLRGEMALLLDELVVGDAIAASGVVRLLDGVAVVEVDATGSLVRIGSLGQAIPIGLARAVVASPAAAARDTARNVVHEPILGSGPTVGVLLALAIASLALAATVIVRRRLARRQLRLALVDRLATLRDDSPPAA